jgi:hypothetical protein
MRVQFINNVSIVFNFLADYDVKLVGIGPTDIVDGNGLVLGLVWSIMVGESTRRSESSRL